MKTVLVLTNHEIKVLVDVLNEYLYSGSHKDDDIVYNIINKTGINHDRRDQGE